MAGGQREQGAANAKGATEEDMDTDDYYETHTDATDNFGNQLGATNTDETESDATDRSDSG